MFLIRQRVELAAPMSVLALSAPLQYGDARAHEWSVEVVRDGEPFDLTGYAISLYARRADNSTAGPVAGSAEDGTATVVFPALVYNVVGNVTLILRAEKAASGNDPAETVTLAALHARVARDTTDTIVSEEVIVPNINELLAQIDAMREGTDAANDAADAANDAADAANTAATAANAAATAANAAAGSANTAAGSANTAAGAANDAAEAAGDITQQVLDQIVPQFSIGTVQTVAPNVPAEVTQGGTTRAPVLNFKIPRGESGDSSVNSVGGVYPGITGDIPLTVCGVGAETDPTDPDYGDIPLTPADLGAVPVTRTVNGKALSQNIALDAEDVGALPDDEPHLREIERWHLATDIGGTWTQETTGYRQTIPCQGLTADDQATVYFDSSAVSGTSVSDRFYYYGLIWCVECQANQVVVHMLSRYTTYFVLEVIR